MNIRNVRIAVFVVMAFGAAPGFAKTQGPWGTPEEAKPCLAGMDTADCKAEIARRAQGCLKDPAEIPGFKGKEWFPKDPVKAEAHNLEFCTSAATDRLKDQVEELAKKQKQVEEEKAALEAAEVPKADTHDAKLEKAVQAAYLKDYPDNKVLKVVLGHWSDDYEKDAFGHITGRDIDATVVNKHPDGKCELHDELWMQRGNGKSFSGPLSARGAGSQHLTQILCSKAESGGASSSSSKPKKK